MGFGINTKLQKRKKHVKRLLKHLKENEGPKRKQTQLHFEMKNENKKKSNYATKRMPNLLMGSGWYNRLRSPSLLKLVNAVTLLKLKPDFQSYCNYICLYIF